MRQYFVSRKLDDFDGVHLQATMVVGDRIVTHYLALGVEEFVLTSAIMDNVKEIEREVTKAEFEEALEGIYVSRMKMRKSGILK